MDPMQRAYYAAPVDKFVSDEPDQILGELTRHHQFALEDLQRNTWISQIEILKNSLPSLPGCYLAFEYVIPRMGKRIDVKHILDKVLVSSSPVPDSLLIKIQVIRKSN